MFPKWKAVNHKHPLQINLLWKVHVFVWLYRFPQFIISRNDVDHTLYNDIIIQIDCLLHIGQQRGHVVSGKGQLRGRVWGFKIK